MKTEVLVETNALGSELEQTTLALKQQKNYFYLQGSNEDNKETADMDGSMKRISQTF